MSDQTAQLLEAFEALPETEKQVFTVEFLRRAIPFDSGPLDDSETAEAADQIMADLAPKRMIPVRGGCLI